MSQASDNPYGNFGFRTVTANAWRSPDRVAITYLGQQAHRLSTSANRR